MSQDRPHISTRRGVLAAGGALFATAGLGGCLISTEPYTAETERSFDPGTADSLAVETERGDVTLSVGDGDAVTGTVRKESRSGEDALESVTVDGTVEDGTLVIEPEFPDEDLNISVHFDFAVPDGLPVERAKTTNGEVSVTGVGGDGRYRSNNGDVTVESVDGYVTVESTNGDVAARETAGLDGAETTNGSVTVDVPAVRDDVTCESTNGDVTVAVPDDLGVAVDLRTVNGDASVSDVDVTAADVSESRFTGTLGTTDPEHTLTLRTTNGDVTLESL